MAEACGTEITERLMLPTVLTMANDSVANVRFNVAKTLTLVGPKLNTTAMQSQVGNENTYSNANVIAAYKAALWCS